MHRLPVELVSLAQNRCFSSSLKNYVCYAVKEPALRSWSSRGQRFCCLCPLYAGLESCYSSSSQAGRFSGANSCYQALPFDNQTCFLCQCALRGLQAALGGPRSQSKAGRTRCFGRRSAQTVFRSFHEDQGSLGEPPSSYLQCE